jgi:hypothetical protein
MHRTKKITVTAMVATLLMSAGVSSASAERGNEDNVYVCHEAPPGSERYVLIRVDENGRDGNDVDHGGHEGDINPAPEDADGDPYCPEDASPPPPPPPPPVEDDDENCSAESSSGDSTQSQSGLINVGNLNLGLNNLLGNLLCQSNVGNGLAVSVIGGALGGDLVDGDGDSDDDCIASSDSGDSEQEQEGLINVGNINLGLNNLLGNALCQSDVLNGGAVSVIGGALGGDLVDGDGDSDDDCIASSDSGDSEQEQEGAVNVGNINVGGDNLLGNALCQADVLNGLAVSLIGPAIGGGGTGLLTSGPLGLLSGTGYLVPGIMADVTVVAGLLLSL